MRTALQVYWGHPNRQYCFDAPLSFYPTESPGFGTRGDADWDHGSERQSNTGHGVGMVPGGPALMSNAPSAVVPTVSNAAGNHRCECRCPPSARNLSLAQLQA